MKHGISSVKILVSSCDRLTHKYLSPFFLDFHGCFAYNLTVRRCCNKDGRIMVVILQMLFYQSHFSVFIHFSHHSSGMLPCNER